MEKYTIPNLKNACKLLKIISESNQPLCASELRTKLDIPHTTLTRILGSLCSEGFIDREGNLYKAGNNLIYCGLKALNNTNIKKLSRSYLEQISTQLKETAHIAIPDQDKAMIIDVFDSPNPLHVASRPGTRVDLYCSSTGKIFLSSKSKEELNEYVQVTKMKKMTDKTIISKKELATEIDKIRSQGYSIDDEEYSIGIRCIAAPIFNADGEICAAIGITAPRTTFPPSRDRELAEIICSFAKKLSYELGFKTEETLEYY
ncbi:MAG: IclR family transcriptional regulator [Spirochaetales bacterium]|nr:IclR family transcriptional regulator [Spirochaetales bacterium]